MVDLLCYFQVYFILFSIYFMFAQYSSVMQIIVEENKCIHSDPWQNLCLQKFENFGFWTKFWDFSIIGESRSIHKHQQNLFPILEKLQFD
jgi:hypothetical protein